MMDEWKSKQDSSFWKALVQMDKCLFWKSLDPAHNHRNKSVFQCTAKLNKLIIAETCFCDKLNIRYPRDYVTDLVHFSESKDSNDVPFTRKEI